MRSSLLSLARGAAGAAALLLFPFAASAHEVYVLTHDEIQHDIASPGFSWWSVIAADMHHFMFWAFIGILTVLVIFGISIIRPLERALLPMFERMKPYAPHIPRITVGMAYLAGAWYQAAYGPELPLAANWGPYTPLITAVLVIVGGLMIAGLYVRTAALAALALFAANVYFQGWYMLTYTNYLGEILVLLLIGAHGFHGARTRHTEPGSWAERVARFSHKAKPYAFLILRVGFGVALFYASFYAKFLHNDLALDVAQGTGILPTVVTHAYTVAQYLGFEPHFLVIGAGIVEFVIALFFIFGIEIRFTALFLEFWLALSLWYFGEVVWPHLILIGIPIAFIFYGYDKYSIEGWLFKKRKMEPVL
jgi:uncharacterized membrane protein YphA (DoxX/SURF4 family)